MNSSQAEQALWVQARLKDRVSFSGWFVTVILGLWLWSLLFRLL